MCGRTNERSMHALHSNNDTEDVHYAVLSYERNDWQWAAFRSTTSIVPYLKSFFRQYMTSECEGICIFLLIAHYKVCVVLPFVLTFIFTRSYFTRWKEICLVSWLLDGCHYDWDECIYFLSHANCRVEFGCADAHKNLNKYLHLTHFEKSIA